MERGFKAQTKGDSTDILNTYLKPYLKDIDLTDSESDLFLIFLDFDLSGKIRYIIFAYPEKINIPFEVLKPWIQKCGKIAVWY